MNWTPAGRYAQHSDNGVYAVTKNGPAPWRYLAALRKRIFGGALGIADTADKAKAICQNHLESK